MQSCLLSKLSIFPSRSSYNKSFFSTSKTFTGIGGDKHIPLCEKRDSIIEKTFSQLGIEKENSATVPELKSKGIINSTPYVSRYDPTTKKSLTKLQNATWEETNALLDMAKSAQNRWRQLSGNKRVEIVLEMNAAIEALVEPLANLETLEIGKIPTESRGELIEIFDVATLIQQRKEECGGNEPYITRVYDSSDPKRKELGWKGEERQIPLGILGKVTAFNFPYAVFGWGALPALCAGNAVILKPHPDSSITSLSLVRIMNQVAAKHGFEGLVSMTTMSDWGLTQKLWKDPRIDMWEVTGSEAMGKDFLSHVYPTFKRTLLELGGNNAIIIHKDANLSNAIESTLFGATGTCGQRCTSTRIIYIHEQVFDKVVEGLVEGYQTKLRIGDPFQPGVNVGPLHHERQVDTFRKANRIYSSSGSQLLVGGEVLSGNFVEPTLYKAPSLRYDALLDEYFCPVAHVVLYKDNQVDDVIQEINRSGYGLSGGIFTKDDSVFKKFVENVKVGIFNHNYGTSGAEAGENFGGEGKTGGGRQLGPNMFKSYTRYINSMRSPADSKVIHAQGVDVNA